MGEADWWLCSHCQSLNNLSARKCYSCRKRKPKDAVRASKYLGYVPVVDQNGKISLETILPPVAVQQARDENRPPPLRDPVTRDTLAVAPRPPHGARFTYQMTVPLQPPPPGNVATAQAGPRPLVAVGPGPDGSPVERPAVGSAPAAADPTQRWPHWRELLDVPAPEVERLRAAYGADGDDSTTTVGATASHSTALRRAIRTAKRRQDDGTRLIVPWPEADRPKE